jgi:hypothetical protein
MERGYPRPTDQALNPLGLAGDKVPPNAKSREMKTQSGLSL